MEIQLLNNKLQELAQKSGKDVYYYTGLIEPISADRLILSICKRGQFTDEAYFLLTTHGGDPDSAYRIIRALRSKYKRVILLVVGWCKSAGTLIALGANEIAMSDMGEFGPLDIQLMKDDEVNSNNRTSGNDLVQALISLHGQAMLMYKSTFDDLINHSNGVMTTKTASEIAKTLVIGLLSPIFAQVEPVRMGAIARSNSIALNYGVRLGASPALVNRLVNTFPSHGFVIDRDEAKHTFIGIAVRELNAIESSSLDGLEIGLRYPSSTPQVGLLCCTTEGQNGAHDASGSEPSSDGNNPGATGAGDVQDVAPAVPRGSRKSKAS